jgi:uncharacterized iron-regulated membrane protein
MVRSRLTASSIRRWSAVHTGTSLLSTIFLLLLCLTGLPLIFKDEIDEWVYHEPEVSRQETVGSAATLDRSIRATRDKYPGEYVHFFFWHPQQPQIIVIGMAPEVRSTTPKLHAVAVDTDTGAIVAEPKPRRGMTFYLLKLHTDLFLNLPGKLFLGFMGLLMLAALVSGGVLYGPFMRRVEFGTVRFQRTRARWLDLHNLIGITTLIWCLVVAATGAFNTLAAPLFDLWRAKDLPLIIDSYKGMPAIDRLAPIDAVVELARVASPGMKLVSVIYPQSRFTTEQHYLVWTKGTTPLTAHLFVPVLIDATTGQLTAKLQLPFYIRALELARPLHFGNYAGMPLKMIWAGFDIFTIVVLVTGVYLWVSRRRQVFKPMPELA